MWNLPIFVSFLPRKSVQDRANESILSPYSVFVRICKKKKLLEIFSEKGDNVRRGEIEMMRMDEGSAALRCSRLISF